MAQITLDIETQTIVLDTGAAGARGLQGPTGSITETQGDYDSGTAYSTGHVVLDQGSSWVALQDTTGNAPPTLPTTSNAYWQLVAQKGDDGVSTGDVVGPASATDGNIALYDGTTGKLIKDGPANNATNWDTAYGWGDHSSAGYQLRPSEGAFANGDKTKLDGIESGATADQTAQEIATAIDADATAENTLRDAIPASTTAKGTVELATSAEWRTGTDTARALGVSETWGSAAEVTLTDGATIAVDFSTFINAVVTLGGNRALGNPTNEKVGQSGVIRIVQDGTGSRTLSYGTDWEFAGGTAPTLTTTASAQDLLFYHIIATDRVFAALVKGIA